MGRRNDDQLNDREEQAADHAMRALLQRHDHPAAPAFPPDLASRISRQLPTLPPAEAMRAERRRTLQRRIATWSSAVMVLLLSGLGAWGVLVDSTLPAVLLGGPESALGHTALVVTLAAKPMIGFIMSLDVTILLSGMLLMLAASWLWWRLLAPPAVLAATESRL